MSDRDFDIDGGNWFPIMHEMADKLMTYRLSGTEWQILFMFMRLCYGYKNSACELRWRDIKKYTGLGDSSISKAIGKLKKRNIIKTSKKESKTTITYKINSKIGTWKTLHFWKDFTKVKQNTSLLESVPYKINKNIYSREDEEKKDKKTQKPKSIPYAKIISRLNEKTGKQFKPTTKETRRAINARWNEGFRLDDFNRVIDIKSLKWKKDAKMVDFLRPQTLFGTKFEAYLNESPPITDGQPASTEINADTVEDIYANP